MSSSLDSVAECVAVCCSVLQCSVVSDELRHVVEFGLCVAECVAECAVACVAARCSES